MTDLSTIHLIGSAHLDPIWLWRWQEGCGEVLQTFRSALDRLNEYDDFVFTCSSAAYYKWVEEIAPDMFNEIVERVKQGRWVPVNGWWVQPDCNMPSGESFARQALYSQLYYNEKFGRICNTGYNVDSFGHSAMLPQLLKQGGMSSYVFLRPEPHENADIPDTFIWESMDGSKVLSFKIPSSYTANGKKNIDNRIDIAEGNIEKYGHGVMLFYGVGNHGGGPTRGDIEYLQQNLKSENHHRMQFSDPDKYFKTLCMQMPDLPVWKTDLQHHASGCYSATSLVKQLNRKAENSLYCSEAFTTIAVKNFGMGSKTQSYKEAWRDVCFNQFHDIMCGCSIMEAYDDVRDSTGHALTISDRSLNEALLRICRKIDTWIDGVSTPVSEVRNQDHGDYPRPVVVFNPLSFAVKVPVRTYYASKAVKTADGKDVPFQNVRSSRSNDSHLDTCFIAELPPLGYATYWLQTQDNRAEISSIKSDVTAKELTMENRYIKVSFSAETGFITSLYNKETDCEYASEEKPLAVPTVIDDHKTDTWAHNVFKFHDIKGTMSLEKIELVEAGSARAVIRAHYTFGGSYLVEDFILASEQKTLRVKCKANWREKFTLLKMSFRTNGSDHESIYEIPAGFIRRPVNGEEEPSQRWAAISYSEQNIRRSLCIVNDSKYSYDCPDNDLRLTCLRNVIFADHYSDRPAAEFNFTDEGMQRFEYGIFTCDGEPENSRVTNEAAAFNIRPTLIPESYHKGSLPQAKSFINVSADNIIMTALKECEDNSGDIVMRFYETRGMDTSVRIICETANAAFRADFGRNEIKTFRISADGKVKEVNFLEGNV